MEDYGIKLTKEEEGEVDRLCDRIHERVAKEAMTPRQRFEAVYRGEEPDRIPIQVCALGLHAAANYGVRPSALYKEPKTSLFAYLTHLERFGYDMPSTFRFSTGEAEFGMEVEYTDSAVPFGKKSVVNTAADFANIKFPNVRKDGSLPYILWLISILKEKLGDIMPIHGMHIIPGAVVPTIMTMEQQLLTLRKDPVLAHCVAAVVTKFCIDYDTAQFEAGADMLHIVGIDDQISYKHHREFEFPYLCGLLKSVPGPCFQYGAGDWSHVLESYAQAGVQGFFLHSGQPTPLEKAKEVAMQYKLTLRYGVNAQILLHGPTERIREEVKRVIKQGWPGSRFVLITDTLDYNTPAAHLDAYMDAAREYGQLPLSF